MSLIPAFKIGVWNAWLFMSVFFLQMIAILFVDKRIREKSHVPIDARRNRFEKYVGIIGNFIWLLAMGYSVFLPLQPGTIWFYVGLSIFIIGLVLMAIATVNFITTPVDLLITKGTYQLSRHPMYLATFLSRFWHSYCIMAFYIFQCNYDFMLLPRSAYRRKTLS